MFLVILQHLSYHHKEEDEELLQQQVVLAVKKQKLSSHHKQTSLTQSFSHTVGYGSMSRVILT